ncbi:MAG: Hsp70 family protein, partial [Patescibacteria group bacterium]
GVPQIEVTFDIDSNGILSVSARDKGTNKEQKITIQNATHLTDAEVEQMKNDAEMHAREDEEKHGLVESKNRLDATIFSGEKTLKDFADKIKPEDKVKIEEKLKAGKDLIAKADAKKDEYDKFTEELNQILQVVGQAVYGQPEAGQPGQPGPETNKAPKSDDQKDNGKKDAEEGEVVK